MLQYFMKIMGLSPSPEELKFSKRMNASWQALQLSNRGRISVDTTEILEDKKERPANVAANILRGSRLTKKEAEELIEIINYATIPK